MSTASNASGHGLFLLRSSPRPEDDKRTFQVLLGTLSMSHPYGFDVRSGSRRFRRAAGTPAGCPSSPGSDVRHRVGGATDRADPISAGHGRATDQQTRQRRIGPMPDVLNGRTSRSIQVALRDPPVCNPSAGTSQWPRRIVWILTAPRVVLAAARRSPFAALAPRTAHGLGTFQAVGTLGARTARKKTKAPDLCRSEAWSCSGRYWDRTSDLFGVNEALSP
jgi:hypothetical protein